MDAPYIDYHETFPTRWEIAAAYAICCAKCHETKHPRLFRRQLTRAQAAFRGYTGVRDQSTLPRQLRGLRVMTVESKYCAKCQPGHYKPTDMTVKEMYKAAYDGKASLHRVNVDADMKRKKARRKISAAVSDRWAKWREAPWTHIRARLADALTAATHSINYNRHRKIMKDEGVPEILAFFDAYQGVLRTMRARCTLNARTQAKVEPETTWEDMTGAPTMRRLEALWSEVPVDVLKRMNTSPLLLNRAHPLVLEGYVAARQDSIDRLSTVRK